MNLTFLISLKNLPMIPIIPQTVLLAAVADISPAQLLVIVSIKIQKLPPPAFTLSTQAI